MDFSDLVFPTAYQGCPFTDEAEIALAKLIATIYVADAKRSTDAVVDYAIACWAETLEKRDGVWDLKRTMRLKSGAGRPVRVRRITQYT